MIAYKTKSKPFFIRQQPNNMKKYGLTLLDIWQETCSRNGTSLFVTDIYNRSYTYDEINQKANRLANFFRLKRIGVGDIVTVQIPGWCEFPIILIACQKVGAIMNPICMIDDVSEVAYIMGLTKSKIMFIPTHYRQRNYVRMASDLVNTLDDLELIVQVTPMGNNRSIINNDFQTIMNNFDSEFNSIHKSFSTDLLTILFTSGTTGFPKGVQLTQENVIYSEKKFIEMMNLRQSDCLMMPAPLNHATGLHHGIIATIMRGSRIILQDKYEVEKCLTMIRLYHCNFVMGVPTVMFDLIHQIDIQKTPSLRFLISGGAPLNIELVKSGLEKGLAVYNIYGSTESVPYICTTPAWFNENRGVTTGIPIDGVEIKIIDKCYKTITEINQIGEICCRGPQVTPGYYHNLRESKKVIDSEGWYHSGDLAKVNEKGVIELIGRIKDTIIRGGENISCYEVEAYIRSNPLIEDVAVTGIPDQRLGERICAFIVPKQDGMLIKLTSIIDYLKSIHVPKKNWPEKIILVDRLPYTESGKVKKYLLKDSLF